MNPANNKYLLVKHSRGWNVDRCCAWMDKRQQAYDWCYPADGEEFPEAGDYAGVIIFGGASSANDCGELPWVKQELAFIENILKHEVPFVGICLGAQMLARVLGSAVTKHPSELKEVGFHPVYPTQDSADFLEQCQWFMQWHSEGFELPPGASAIARGDVFENQAFKCSGNVYGLQFHPEVNPAALDIWLERNRRKNPQALSEQERQRLRADALLHDRDITEWLDAFLSRWVAQ